MLYLDIIFIVFLSLYLWWFLGLIRALKSDAPYVPMKPEVVKKLVDLAQAKPESVWLDLGSGDGRVLIEAVRRYNVKGWGIERISSLRVLARMRLLKADLFKNVRITGGDFFKQDFSKADVISFYLLPKTNERLIEKLRREAKKGAILVAHRFPIPDMELIRSDEENKIFVARV